MNNPIILVTGGAGYIGSHTLIALDEAGYDFVVYDNLCNSSVQSIKRVEKIIGKSIKFEQGDIRDKASLEKLFNTYDIDSVIHFAGLKAVVESVEQPLQYYDNNVNGTLVLLEVMKKFKCKKIERILKDLYISDTESKIAILRYFNPVGAHESGSIGEDPNGIPNNLMPFIAQTAVGKRERLSVFGGDYDTQDGTGVRDYIHVVDLAAAHVKAIEHLNRQTEATKPLITNIGTGKGYSVLDMVRAFEKASQKDVPYKIVERRTGDIAKCFADPIYAKEMLGWEAKKTLDEMCEDSWKWQMNNPNGYNTEENI